MLLLNLPWVILSGVLFIHVRHLHGAIPTALYKLSALHHSHAASHYACPSGPCLCMWLCAPGRSLLTLCLLPPNVEWVLFSPVQLGLSPLQMLNGFHVVALLGHLFLFVFCCYLQIVMVLLCLCLPFRVCLCFV